MNLRAVWKILPSLLVCLLLSGCASSYMVSVDSLRDDRLITAERSCYLEPGNPGVSPDDLLFREISRMLEPAFHLQGWDLVTHPSAAANIARISYWEEEPQVTIRQSTTRTTKPVVLWDGKKEHIEYVTVEEPTISTQTIYYVGLRVETRRQDGKQIWRTTVRCSGYENDFRLLLSKCVPVLERMLGSRTNGVMDFEVSEDGDGRLTVEAVNAADWW